MVAIVGSTYEEGCTGYVCRNNHLTAFGGRNRALSGLWDDLVVQIKINQSRISHIRQGYSSPEWNYFVRCQLHTL